MFKKSNDVVPIHCIDVHAFRLLCANKLDCSKSILSRSLLLSVNYDVLLSFNLSLLTFILFFTEYMDSGVLLLSNLHGGGRILRDPLFFAYQLIDRHGHHGQRLSVCHGPRVSVGTGPTYP